jgi:hypothetical protein
VFQSDTLRRKLLVASLQRLRSLFAKWTISEISYKKREDPELFGKTVAGRSGAGN